jgi:hypothetical protein
MRARRGPIPGLPHTRQQMKVVDSKRRQIVMAVLLGLAMVGAAVRYWAPNPSALRDVGTLLLVLWLPAVGNLVGFLIRKIPRRARDFSANAPFQAQLSADVEHLVAGVSLERCTVVVGQEGFTARTRAVSANAMDFEFLRPDMALVKLPPSTEFHLLVGATTAARGRVKP